VRSAQVLAVRALLLGALVASAACYRPKNLSGGFSCGTAGACPEGLVCNPATQICVSSFDAGATGTGGVGGTTGSGGKGGTAGIDAGVDRPCTGAIASCQPSDAGLCDPVCNTGCGECYQKCSVNTNGNLTCNDPYTPPPPTPSQAGLLQYCSQLSPRDAGGQSDNCGAGQVCLNASACGVPRCYQFCRHDTDCTGGATCSRDGGDYKFCDVPNKKCDPVAGGTGAADCGNGLNCYLSSTGTMNTLCDCQFDRTPIGGGTGRPGDVCNRSRDCLPGNVCVFLSAMLGNQCKAVCRLPADGGPQDTCAGGCQPLQASGGSIYGWCNN
jgi:hypothetical protein